MTELPDNKRLTIAIAVGIAGLGGRHLAILSGSHLRYPAMGFGGLRSEREKVLGPR